MAEDYQGPTPPPDLVRHWLEDSPEDDEFGIAEYIATKAANWGADQELEACVEWLGEAPVVYNDNGDLHPNSYLRDARRPKPPSLAEQAMQAMHRVDVIWATDEFGKETMDNINAIRRALERLQELENNG